MTSYHLVAKLEVSTRIFSNWSNLSEDEIFELLVNITKQNEEDLLVKALHAIPMAKLRQW